MSERNAIRALSDHTETKVECIHEGELAYHQRMLEDAQQAEAMMAEAERLAATAQAKRASNASWTSYLVERYGLVDGDHVAQDGTITRRGAIPASEPS